MPKISKVILATVLLAVSPALAQTLPTLPPPAAPASSTRTLATQLVAVLMGPPAPPLSEASRVMVTVGGVPEGLVGEPVASFLADAIEAQLAPLPGFGQRVRARAEASEVIEVTLEVKEGHLMATARRRVLPKTIWEALAARAEGPAGAPGRVVATAYVNVAIDLELRTLLGLGRREVRLDRLRVVPVTDKSLAAVAAARVLDCAVGDLDGDREPELVLLQTDAVRAARWAAGGFSKDLGFYPLSEVPPSPAPLREPLGKMVAVTREGGRVVLVAASSDREGPLVVGIGPLGVERLPLSFQRGWPLYASGVERFVVAPWPLGIDSLEGGLTEVRFGASAATWIGGASRVHDVRAFAADGRGAWVAALVGGGVRVIPGGDDKAAGVVSALTDFDADGARELLTTSQTLGGPDRLGLGQVPEGAAARPGGWRTRALWTGVAPAPVTAMCSGDVDRDGYDEVIAATWSGSAAELLIVVPR